MLFLNDKEEDIFINIYYTIKKMDICRGLIVMKMVLEPIGVVRKNSVKKEELRKAPRAGKGAGLTTKAREGTAEIEIFSRFRKGLDRIEKWQHLWVFFWFHELPAKDRRLLQAHPRGDTERPKCGVFALRSPMRPNPLGLCRVRLLRREGNILVVKGLDAFEGTPVVDIKPWVAELDAGR